MSINSISASISTVAPTVHEKSGTINSSQNGGGIFDTLVTQNGNVTTRDTKVTFANGKSYTNDVTITNNADGSKTIEATRTLSNGKVFTTDETLTKTADGVYAVSGTDTEADGTVDTVSNITGMQTRTGNGTVTDLSITNAKGQVETLDSQYAYNSTGSSYTATGTGFNGKPISRDDTKIFNPVGTGAEG